jgi:hypothetical protein
MVKDYYEVNEETSDSSAETPNFVNLFEGLDSKIKGTWAEQATIKEAISLEHIILVDHPENPNKSGFDCVSIDPTNSKLHIWEAKNYGQDTRLSVNNLTAWEDVKNGEFRKGYLESVREIIKSVPDGKVRDTVQKSILEGNVSYHLRIGPETKLSSHLEENIREILPLDTEFDIQKYSHKFMNESDISIITDNKNMTENMETQTLQENDYNHALELNEWIDQGVKDIPIEKIDTRDTQVYESNDFQKVSKPQMIDGLTKLVHEIVPAIKEGANGDDFSELDKRLGIDYENGYRRIYDAFYGNDSIRLVKDGDTYEVVNGYHRIYVAKELGLDSLPALVLERKKK